jgi:GNAT superfamily N-acetyltransferase
VTKLDIRKATRDEFAIAVEWAAREGWNPGLGDLAAFHAADPAGFLIGYLDGEPAASISVVRYDGHFGFLGFYIVPPEHRGKGFGLQIWNAGLAHLGRRTIGLDGVVAQQANYRKSGFELAGRNIRFTGTFSGVETPAGSQVQPLSRDALDEVVEYERPFFPANRHLFIEEWCCPTRRAPTRTGVVARADGNMTGFGIIRRCRSGYKIGPLFAADQRNAAAMLSALCATMEPGSTVSLDVPEDNAAGTKLAEQAGLEPSFETARMYKGGIPSLPIARTFGISTFELG